MGTNKHYGGSIDRDVARRQAAVAAREPDHDHPHRVLRVWAPPWPPIQVSTDEWIVMRDDKRVPAAVIRRLRLGPREEMFFRVVTWAPESADRQLVGYFPTLAEADRIILFTSKNPVMPRRPNEGQGVKGPSS